MLSEVEERKYMRVREMLLFKNIVRYSLLCITAIALFGLWNAGIWREFTPEQLRTLLLLLFAIYLWVAAPIPTGASSILILAMLLLLGLVDTMEEAVIGFLSPALYFIFMLSLISKSLVKVGMDRVIAGFLLKISRGGPAFVIIGMPLFISVLPIFLPSAVARFKMLLPVTVSLNRIYGFTEKSVFQKYCIYVIGMMNQNATMIIYTGGGFPILASQLIRDYQIANLGWMDWFLLIAPPLWIGAFILAFLGWNYLKRVGNTEDKEPIPKHEEMETEEINSTFWIMTGAFVLMILTWIVTDQNRVPLLLPPMLLIVFYSLPRIGLITNRTIRSFDWENFLLLGASFSLGYVLEANGTAQQLAGMLVELIPDNAGIVIKVVIIALIVFVLRFFFVVPSSAVIVIFPIVMSYSELIGLPPIQLAFLIILIIGSMMVLPIHTTTSYLAYDTGILSKKEHYTISIFSSLFFMVIAILSTLYYW